MDKSYTKFANKIGLSVNNELLRIDSQVVLNFPYKDCVLKGGQSKDEERSKEIFFNEILAHDEIDVLFVPKVLHKFELIGSNSSLTQDTRIADSTRLMKDSFRKNIPNLLIKGNNLIALHSLKNNPAIYGKVKLIYIDPPYNTGNDSFNYNDKFTHSAWLSFMKNRLEIAREFLRDDGVIFVQCDDNEQAYLKVLMDEIFGRENFVNCIVVKMSEISGVKMSHTESRLPKLKEYILVYKKQKVSLNSIKNTKISNLENFKSYAKYYSKIILNPNDSVENWKIVTLNDYVKMNNIEFKNDNEMIEFKIKNAHRMVYRTNNKSWKNLKTENEIQEIISQTGIKYICWNGKQMLFLSDYLQEALGDLWSDLSTINLNKEGGCNFTNAKKPEALLKRIIELSTKEGDLVMDFFAGSGTTLAVAHKMNRKWVGVEQMDYIETITKARLEKVIAGEQGGVSKAVGWQGGGEFVYCELMPLNAVYKEQIIKAKNAVELESIYKYLQEKAFLDYRVVLQEMLKDKEFKELDLESKKEILKLALDSNMDYVPLGDIADSTYNISSEIIALNRAFYGKENE